MSSGLQTPAAFVRDSEERLVETTMDLLAYDTSNPPGETAEIAADVESRLADLGLETETFAVDPEKPNVMATLPGEREETLLFNGHFDTVPYDAEGWSADPLGERRDGRIYGRGATDMKGQVAAMLEVARAFVETETTPPLDLRFVFVSDEETGGDAGIEAMLDGPGVEADACVIGETTCCRGRHSITVADRGCIWLTLEADGESAHGSRPMLGENAVDRLYDALTTLREQFGDRPLDLDPDLDPIVDESVAYYEPTIGASAARDLFQHPTINVGTIEGGEAINVVPSQATARVDLRLTAGVETEAVLADVETCIDECEGVSVADVSWSVGSYEPVDSPLVDAATELASDVMGESVYRRSATGGGDAKKFRHAGVPTVELGMGTDTVHAVDEFTTTEALVNNATAYARLPYALADRL